ncbi:MAG: DUF1592 domain-containing protein [Pirellulaceae bacterium]
MFWKQFACCATLLAGIWNGSAGSTVHAQSQKLAPEIRQLLNSYCGQCHAAQEQKGNRRFDTLAESIEDDNALVDYQDIVDMLNLGDMPPSDARQPTDEARQEIIDSLSLSIQEYHESQRGAAQSTVLRRLNAREYRNTMRDLLHLDMTMFDPTVAFPSDQLSEHLDNNGEALVASEFWLASALDAAESTVDKAFGTAERPTEQEWKFNKNFRQQPEIDQVHGRSNGFAHLTLYDVTGADKHEGAYAAIEDFADGVPHDGIYEIRFRAEAKHRLHPYDDKFLRRDRHEPLRIGIVPGNRKAGKLYVPQPIEPLLVELELADDMQWYTVRIPLDAGWTPRFTFRNGLMDARSLWTKLPKAYPELFAEKVSPKIVESRRACITEGQVPQIRIHEVHIRGPLVDAWPTPAQRAVLGNDFEAAMQTGELSEAQIRSHLERFATLAYRRPIQGAEIERLMQLAARRQQAGRSSLEAYQDALQSILCSPNFLYLSEGSEESNKLSAYQLASRLSYFLWSSMPDEELLKLASTGELHDPAILESQVDRMLHDKKAAAWVDGFLDNLLTLRDLGSMPPDRSRYVDYYQFELHVAMRRETFLFIEHLVHENLNLRHLVDANFTFVNKPLAKLYGMTPPAGWQFCKVDLPDGRRGGLLGQASILTVTANGIDTSPVMRGVWLLDHLLGTPAAPPPPDVEPLDPDVRGAITIRQQLEKHRQFSSCNECHRKIDPLGFALENFDPIGRWRDKYPSGREIDASGELPQGDTFKDIIGLKAILLEREALWTRALTERLLAYATGRHIRVTDRPQVDAILRELHHRGSGLGDLVKAIVVSSTFQHK